MNTVKLWIQQNKIVTALFIFVIIDTTIQLLFSHSLIRFFYQHYNTNWSRGIVLVSSFILSLSWAGRAFSRTPNLISIARQGLATLKRGVWKQRKPIFVSFLLGLFFYFLYLSIAIASTPGYGTSKFTFFFADRYKWVDLNWSIYHKGSHPLILIFLAPFSFIKYFSPWVPKLTLAVVLNSFFGALTVFFSALFFWNYTKNYVQTILLTMVLGLTTSHLLFSVFLESYALSAASIIPSYLLLMICLNQRKIYGIAWILVGIFSFGVTITNFYHSIVCFGIVLLLFKKENRWVSMLEYIGSVVAIAFFLNLIQQKFLGGETFFVRAASGRELDWIRTTILTEPILIIQELTKHFFLVNFVASSPFPAHYIPKEKFILSFFDRPLNYSFWGFMGTAVWLFVLVRGIYHNLFYSGRETSENGHYLTIASALSLFGYLVFHSIFNTEEMFIYTCHFTFLVLVLATPKYLLDQRYFQIAIALLILLTGINNLSIIHQIIIS